MWHLLPQDRRAAEGLARCCGVDPLIAQLLLNRGISRPDEARRFFSPALEQLSDPLRLPDMAQAVLRIRQAVTAREPILVFGDADVDGITASAILYEALTSLGAKVVVRLSNRIADGYGFPAALIKQLVRLGVKLLLLVDCGTNQREDIRELARQGIETIVVDHHVPTECMAKPLALVNPHRDSRQEPTPCSAGLALKLVQALCPQDREAVLRALDLAALGTLADYAPLLGDNRVIVSLGLKRLRVSQRLGLQRLCETVRITQPTPQQILQRLVPCLNAAGRLGNPRPVWELLVEPSARVVDRLVGALGRAHTETKALHRQILAEAHEQVSRLHFKDQLVMVVGRRGWHPGLMGPVAAQLLERYARPAIAIAFDGQLGVGSGRAPSAFNLFEALQACHGTLLRYGGHPQACGLTIHSEDVERFRERINEHAKAAANRSRLGRNLQIDVALRLEEMTTSFVGALADFQPFGPGNPQPLVLLQHVAVTRQTQTEGWVSDGTVRIRTRGNLAGFSPTERYDVVVRPGLSQTELRLALCDARLSTGTHHALETWLKDRRWTRG